MKSAPLTFQQQWAVANFMHEQVWVVPLVLRLLGPLNVDVLTDSLDAVVKRHDALRTRVVSVNGLFEQHVDEWSARALEVIDLSEVPEDGREGEAHELIGEIIRKRRDLARELPSKFVLLRLGKREHVLACVMQHIVFDGFSIKIFSEELWSLYGDFIYGRDSSLSYVVLQYPDYAIRQRSEYVQWLGEHESYWRSTLAGAVRVRLPYNAGLENVDSLCGARVIASFGVPLSSALQSLCRKQRVGLTTIMLTIFSIVLSSWSGQEDLLIPLAVTGRCGVAQMKMVGQVAEFIPLRLRLRGDETIADMFNSVSLGVISACEHLDFGRIVTESAELFRGASMSFASSFWWWRPVEWENRSNCPAVELFPLRVTSYEGKFAEDMSCRVYERNSCITGVIVYRADLFSRDAMELFLESMKGVAERVARDPEVRISSLQRLVRLVSV